MSSDGGLRPLFRARLPAAHWLSVETGGTASGVPDANYCLTGAEGWIEFKRTPGRAVRFRPGQLPWIRQRCAAGGRVTVVVRQQSPAGMGQHAREARDVLWLWDGAAAGLLAECGLMQDSRAGCLGWWGGGPARWRWDRVALTLRRRVGGAGGQGPPRPGDGPCAG